MAKAIPGRVFPIDPTLGVDDSKYRYGVVVRAECGPHSNEVLIYVDSDTILTGTDAIQIAIDDWRNDTGQGPYSPPPPPGDTGNCVFTGRIVQVGRRSDVPAF